MLRAIATGLRRVGFGGAGLFALTVLLAGAALDLSGFTPGPALAQEAAAEAALPAGAIVPPKLTEADYPTIAGVNSRVVVWLAAQLHLWFASAWRRGTRATTAWPTSSSRSVSRPIP
jgi:hypothetical protein